MPQRAVSGRRTAAWLQKKIAGYVVHPAIWIALYLLLWRRSGAGAFFLSSLASLYFDVGCRHRVGHSHFFPDLQVSRDFGTGVTIDFPTVLPFLDRNHRIGYLEHWPGYLVSLSARGKSCAAERETRCG